MFSKELLSDILQWDIQSWSKALQYWEDHVDWQSINHALELGGRQGGLSLWLATRNKQVICSDLHHVQEVAEALHIKYIFCNSISYEDIDASAIPYENKFDLIVFKSILGGIGKNNNYEIQKKVFREIHKALKPNGVLLYAENMVASPVHQFIRKKFVPWGTTWRYPSINEMHELMQDFSSYSFHTSGVLGAFGRSEQQRTFLSYIDGILLNHICPKSWKYIGYGIATK